MRTGALSILMTDRCAYLKRIRSEDSRSSTLEADEAELDQRPDENRLDEDEDRRAGVDENSEEEVYVPIDVCPLMEDRIGVVPTTGGEQCRHGDRQRDRTRFAGTRPAQAG